MKSKALLPIVAALTFAFSLRATANQNTCSSKLTPVSTSQTEISSEYWRIADSTSDLNGVVGVVITVKREYEQNVLKKLTHISYHYFAVTIGDTVLVHAHLYRRELTPLVRLSEMHGVLGLDLELQDKIHLGLASNELPDRYDETFAYSKFNSLLLDAIIRLPQTEFTVYIGIARPSEEDLTALANHLPRGLTLADPSAAQKIDNQFIKVTGKGSDILGLVDDPAVTSVQLVEIKK